MEKKLARLLKHISNYQSILLDKRFNKFGFGNGQYPFFLTIAGQEGLNQKEISDILQVNKATTNKAIKKLEELGYVETRVDADDRRLHCVYLTAQGHEILPEVKRQMREHNAFLSKNLDDETLSMLHDALIQVEKDVMEEIDKMRKDKGND